MKQPVYRVYGNQAKKEKMEMVRPIFLLIVCISVGMVMACANNRTEVRGTAVAERSSDGTVTIRKPTSAEINALSEFDRQLKEINQKYPGPQLPAGAPLYKVTSVIDEGTIVLEDGQKIRMEGLECSSEGTIYLQRFLAGESDMVSYIASHSDGQNPIRAYVWHATLTLMNDPELKKYETGPAYSSLNEAALMSGWCSSKRSSSNTYNDRYEALSKIAPKR
jgi:hypothetical protein